MKIKTKQFNRQKYLWKKGSIKTVLAQIRFQCKRQSKTERSEAFWANIKTCFTGIINMFPPNKSSSGYKLSDYTDVLCQLEPFRVMMSANWSKNNEILSCINIQNITLKIKTANNIMETYIHISSQKRGKIHPSSKYFVGQHKRCKVKSLISSWTA